MKQLDLLWQYQKLDLEMDELEKQIKSSSLRHKLVKLMNYLKEQQAQLIKLNDEADKKNHIYTRIKHEFENINDGLKADEEYLATGEAKNLKQLEQMEKRMFQAQEKLGKKENELAALLDDMESFNKRLQDVRSRINRGKDEYAKNKKEYDETMKVVQNRYVSIKAKRDEIGGKIEDILLNKYRGLKPSHSIGVADIEQGRCGGCNMTLASLVIQNVKEQIRPVECENCGRILYAGAKE